MERVRREEVVKGTGKKPVPEATFVYDEDPKYYVPTGCQLLNESIGAAGWPKGRFINIVGDKSTGKTLLAIEAAANCHKNYPKDRIWYREAEAAFDKSYAASLGMPVDIIKFWDKDKPFDTVEDLFEDLEACCDWAIKHKTQGLYIVDSLDALSDRKEMKREIDENTYGQDKAKQMSQMFRRITRKVEKAQICVIIISQVRANIGVTFGRKTTRSGGAALDFYASLVIYLAHMETIKRTKKGQTRAVGIRIRAKVDKNKIGPPFRECEFFIRFNYGVEDLQASLKWLGEVKRLELAGLTKATADDIVSDLDRLDQTTYTKLLTKVNAAVTQAWSEVEASFLPPRKKYDNGHDAV